jgi:hypothetical protein
LLIRNNCVLEADFVETTAFKEYNQIGNQQHVPPKTIEAISVKDKKHAGF